MAFSGVISAERVTPAPFGLFSVADVTKHGTGDEHWAGGFEYETEACALSASVVDICGGPDIEVVNAPEGDRFFKVNPFGIKARDECLTQGFTVVDRRARVLRQLELITPKAVETELWNGTYSEQVDPNNTRYLASPGATVQTGGPYTVKRGVALLESQLARCGAGIRGVIHMPRDAASLYIGKGDPESLTQVMTGVGNLIAAGAGYDGRGPGELSAPSDVSTTRWIYATGPVYVHLGPGEIVTPERANAVNVGTNVATYVAIRPAAVHWDGCCHFAVQVDLAAS